MLYKRKIILVLLIVLFIFSINISYAKKDGEDSSTGSNSNPNKFNREQHPCEKIAGRNVSTGLTGVLQYDIDCVPFHQNEILDLTGKSSYSIVGWIPRIITVVYRFMFTISVLAFLIASFKYYKAAVTGKGGAGVGFSEAKVALTSSLVGFLIASSAWVIVSMWTRGMSLMVGSGGV